MSIPPLKKGQELLLCLYPESRWGFCSPVGYTQGIFYVREDPKSREKYIDNGMPKSILFPKDSSLTPSSGRSKPAAVQPGVQRAIDRCRSLKLDRVKKGILSLTKKESRLTSPRSITPKKQWRKNKTIGR